MIEDVPSDDEIGCGSKIAADIFPEFVSEIERVAEEQGVDAAIMLYSFWADLTRELTYLGWTPRDLGRDATEIATTQLDFVAKTLN